MILLKNFSTFSAVKKNGDDRFRRGYQELEPASRGLREPRKKTVNNTIADDNYSYALAA